MSGTIRSGKRFLFLFTLLGQIIKSTKNIENYRVNPNEMIAIFSDSSLAVEMAFLEELLDICPRSNRAYNKASLSGRIFDGKFQIFTGQHNSEINKIRGVKFSMIIVVKDSYLWRHFSKEIKSRALNKSANVIYIT